MFSLTEIPQLLPDIERNALRAAETLPAAQFVKTETQFLLLSVTVLLSDGK